MLSFSLVKSNVKDSKVYNVVSCLGIKMLF